MVSQLEEDVASRDRRLSQAKAFKERVDKEREVATSEREQAKVYYIDSYGIPVFVNATCVALMSTRDLTDGAESAVKFPDA